MINTLRVVPYPVDIREIDVNVIATGAAFSQYDVVQLPVDSDGGYTTCITPTAAGIGTTASAISSDAIFGVVLANIAQNAYGRVRIRGKVDAKVLSTADASLVVDGHLFPNTSKQLEFDQAGTDANKKVVATITVGVTGGGGATSTATARTVFFDGINGICRNGGSAS